MYVNPMRWRARARSIQRALRMLDAAPGNVLLILPSTRSALLLARELSFGRDCDVVAGPVTTLNEWALGHALRAPSAIAKAFAGQLELPRTVVSFPDQLVGDDLSFTWLPFLDTRYSFSVIEALLVLRHRPRVFTYRSGAHIGEFSLAEVQYADLLDARAHMASLQTLMARLFEALEDELRRPASDWLAAQWFARKSEAHWKLDLRERLKEIECLLRLHLLTPGCDASRAGTAIAAVAARQRYLFDPTSH